MLKFIHASTDYFKNHINEIITYNKNSFYYHEAKN